MEKNEEATVFKRNGLINIKENFIFIDLSNQHLSYINITLPIELCEIIISHNTFTQVPKCIMVLKNLRKLDLSHNKIEVFDEVPSFCHKIVELDLSNNNIRSPPFWVWVESPKNLLKLNISNNPNLIEALKDEHILALSNHNCQVQEVIMHNCRINRPEIIAIFTNMKSLQFVDSNSLYKANAIHSIPSRGFNKCLYLEKLNLQNTLIHNVTASINVYEKLIEIDLSSNKLDKLPKEFCTLRNLEVCYLSFNQLLYLPEEIVELEKLTVLYLNNNELCMLPNSWKNMKSLKSLDLYDNFLYDVPDIGNFDEIDLAQNYFIEPENDSYIEKQQRMRLKQMGQKRYCGSKTEVVKDEWEHSSDLTDDDLQCNEKVECEIMQNRPPSTSSEDWEVEDWWVPHLTANSRTSPYSPWITFIQKKIEEGHFCPIDLHKEPINKVLQPKIFRTVSGQFDDYSEDDD